MSLRDTSCYTLTLKPSESDPNLVDLVEQPDGPASTAQPKYTRLLQKAEGEAYSAAIFGKPLTSLSIRTETLMDSQTI